MAISAKPYAEKKFAEINGSRMAYIDEGEGDAIVFQHGQECRTHLNRLGAQFRSLARREILFVQGGAAAWI